MTPAFRAYLTELRNNLAASFTERTHYHALETFLEREDRISEVGLPDFMVHCGPVPLGHMRPGTGART